MSDLKMCSSCAFFSPQSGGTGFGYCGNDLAEDYIVEETYVCEYFQDIVEDEPC